jgi:hypothetical protein
VPREPSRDVKCWTGCLRSTYLYVEKLILKLSRQGVDEGHPAKLGIYPAKDEIEKSVFSVEKTD